MKEMLGPTGPETILDIPSGLGLMPNGNIDTNRGAAMYLKMKGQKQGEIKGGTTIKGHEGTMSVYGILQGIKSPRDPASGLPTGKRRHGPIQISVGLDKAVPLCYNLMTNNENISTWKLEYWGAVHKGSASAAVGTGHALLYTVELVNGNLCNIESITTVNGVIMFLLGFTYQKITWTWQDGGITATDDWEAPTA